MKVGTKSLLMGAHQFLLHPALVALAWRRIYGKWPTLGEAIVILFHDIGYIGVDNMDGEDGNLHPRLGESIARLLGPKYAALAAGHSRSYAKIADIPISALCAPDKLASTLVPKKAYLAMTTLTGEVFDYIEDVGNKEKVGDYKKNPELWYDDVVGPGGVLFRQALSLAATPNNLESEPLERSRRHPRSWVTLLCDELMTH